MNCTSFEWLANPNWWLVVLTATLAIATWRLVVKTRDLVTASRDTAKRQLRAYVNVFDVRATWKVEPDDVTMKRVRVEVFFKNTGQTPAHAVATWMIARGMPTERPDFDPGDIEKEIDSLGVQGPGMINHLEYAPQIDNLTHGVIKAWKAGVESLFVFGEIKYVDSFGADRSTSFRFVMPPAGVGDGQGKFQACGREGNEAT